MRSGLVWKGRSDEKNSGSAGVTKCQVMALVSECLQFNGSSSFSGARCPPLVGRSLRFSGWGSRWCGCGGERTPQLLNDNKSARDKCRNFNDKLFYSIPLVESQKRRTSAGNLSLTGEPQNIL